MKKGSTTGQHSHSHCISKAKTRFRSHLNLKDKSLGRIDEPILSFLLDNHRAFGAYDIVEYVSKLGKRVQATQVYRSLENLMELGVVHKLKTKNAFIACFGDGECTSQQFFICDVCDDVSEIQSKNLSASIQDIAKKNKFTIKLPSIEILGVCSECSST